MKSRTHWAQPLLACAGLAALALAGPAFGHNGPAVTASKTEPKLIDGDLSDWDAETHWEPLPFVMNGDPENAADLSGAFAVAVDLERSTLFVALRVRDDVMVREPQDSAIDVLRTNPDGALVYLDLAHRAGFSEAVEASWVRRPLLAVDQSLVPEEQYEIARRETEDGVAYEWRIDLAPIAARQGVPAEQLAAPGLIGFNIEYWDRDSDADGAVLRWTAGPRDGQDSRLLGDLFLSQRPAPLIRVAGRVAWAAETAAETAPRWAHFQRLDAPHIRVHARPHPDGAFHVKLTPGEWEGFASDPLTLQSAGDRVRFRVADAPVALDRALITRPSSLPLERLVAERMEELGVRTAGLAWIEGNAFRFNQSFGVQADGSPADAETVFRVASITKPVSAMAVLSLVEDGR